MKTISSEIPPRNQTSHEQWLADRKNGLGGSDIGVILGLNPKKTPYQLWCEKTGRSDGIVDNNFTRAGVKLEPMVAEWFEEETGFYLTNPGNHVSRHAIHDYILGTPDRKVMDTTRQQEGILEIKTTGQIIDQDDPPMPWFCQLNWYAGIFKSYNSTGYDVNHLAWFERLTCAFNRMEFDYDPAFFDMMVNKGGEFWTKYVLTDTPPPPITGADVASMYKSHTPGKIIFATEELQDKIAELKNLKLMLKQQEEMSAKIVDMLQMVMGDAESIFIDGIPAVTWKQSKDSARFDSKRFEAEHPDLYRQYLAQQSGSRRFLVK